MQCLTSALPVTFIPGAAKINSLIKNYPALMTPCGREFPPKVDTYRHQKLNQIMAMSDSARESGCRGLQYGLRDKAALITQLQATHRGARLLTDGQRPFIRDNNQAWQPLPARKATSAFADKSPNVRLRAYSPLDPDARGPVQFLAWHTRQSSALHLASPKYSDPYILGLVFDHDPDTVYDVPQMTAFNLNAFERFFIDEEGQIYYQRADGMIEVLPDFFAENLTAYCKHNSSRRYLDHMTRCDFGDVRLSRPDWQETSPQPLFDGPRLLVYSSPPHTPPKHPGTRQPIVDPHQPSPHERAYRHVDTIVLKN